MTAKPDFPSVEYCAHRYAAEATETLDLIACVRAMLDRLDGEVRKGNAAGFEVDSVVSMAARLAGSVRTLGAWVAFERGRSAQERADLNEFMAEFKALMDDGSLGARNARAIMAMTPPEVADALLTRVAKRPRDTDGWTMQPFYAAASARLTELRPAEPEPETADNTEPGQ